MVLKNHTPQWWGTQQQNQQIPEMMMYITREQSPDPAAEKKYPRKFQNINGSCLPHMAFSKAGFYFFQAAGGKFHRHTLCFLGKSTLLTEGRIITGAQQIIIPMIGHEVGVGGRSNFLS